LMGSFLFIPSEDTIYRDFARNKEFTFEVRYVLLVVSTTDRIQLFLIYQIAVGLKVTKSCQVPVLIKGPELIYFSLLNRSA